MKKQLVVKKRKASNTNNDTKITSTDIKRSSQQNQQSLTKNNAYNTFTIIEVE